MKDKFLKVFNCIKKFLIAKRMVILLNVIIFILTVFIESIYIYSIPLWLMLINTLVFIAVPTIIFNVKFDIKNKDILLSVPILYILFLIFLNYCTIRDLYYITSGHVDTIPNFIDALFVVFVFSFIEYFTTIIAKKGLSSKKKTEKKLVKKNNQKEEK